MNNVTVLDHPALQHKLSMLRRKSTSPVQFRHAVEELSVQLAYEASRDLDLVSEEIETPIRKTKAPALATWPCLVAVMRSGIAMVRPIQQLLPNASVGHVGVYRDSKLNSTIEYFLKLPQDISNRPVFMLDVLIGTGDTANAVLTRLKEIGATDIRLLSLLTSKRGLKAVTDLHPDVKVVAISTDDDLTEEGFLDPGIGDAGERYFNCD